MEAGTAGPQSTASKIRAALDDNAAKAQEAAQNDVPDQAEGYAAAALKLAQALATLSTAGLT